MSQTQKSFTEKWNQHRFSKLGETKKEIEMLRERLYATLGVSSEEQYKKLFKKGMNILDAGCGVGWAEYLFNIGNHVNYYAMDITPSAVKVAQKCTQTFSNVKVRQGDILLMPYPSNFFDIIYSIGVLHHTGNTPLAFDILCEHLKVGGLIGIYVYCVKPFIRELADKEIREVTTELSFEECFDFSQQVTNLGKSLQEFEKPLIITEDIPLLGIKKGTYNLQRFLYNHFLKCYYNPNWGFEYSTLVNVDWYHPKNATHHTKEEVISWFKKNNIENINFIQPKGWEHSGFFVSGRKKA